MYPTLFTVMNFKVHSYYVLWAFALLMFLYVTFRRSVGKYHTEATGTFSALLWVYFSAIIGTMLGIMAERLPLVLNGSASAKILLTGGTSSTPGLLIGGLVGIWKLRKEKIPVGAFADACSVPLAAMFAIGRIGCLLEGCCIGKITDKGWYTVHFPNDAFGVERFPSQLTEAVFCALLAVLLLSTEQEYKRKSDRAVLFPIYLILYGGYRLFFDRFRELSANEAFSSAPWLSAVAVFTGACWLAHSLYKNR